MTKAEKLIAAFNRDLAERMVHLGKLVERRDRMATAMQALEDAGVQDVYTDVEELKFRVQQRDLPACRRALGKLKLCWKDAYSETRLRVVLSCVDTEGISLEYHRNAPTNGRCQVVESESTYTHYNLICGK